MAKAENTVIFDGQEYKPGDVIPDFKSIKCVDTREPRKYQGLSADVSVLNDVIAKYASGGASCFMSDTGEYYEYDRKEKTWKLITNITERGFDSEKAYGALKHMLKNVSVSDEKIQSAVTDYLTVNPVLPGATTEQAQQIEQNKTDVASLKEETGSLKEDFEKEIHSITNGMIYIEPVNIFNKNEIEDGYRTVDGQLHTANNYKTSNYLKVGEGKTIYASFGSMRFIVAYDSHKNVLPDKGSSESVYSYSVPSGVAYIKISISTDYMNGIVIAYKEVDKYVSYFEPYYKSDNKANVGYVTVTGSIENGQMLKTPYNNIKKNKTISFHADIVELSELNIGHGKTGYGSTYLNITPTKITLYNGAISATPVEYEVNLKLENYIDIQIIDNLNWATLKICNSKNEIIIDGIYWEGFNGEPFVECVNGSLVNCIFTWSSSDFKCKTFYFGDSYTSLEYDARWGYYLQADGFIDSIMINGYPGQESNTAFDAFENIVSIATPVNAVWSLGMNDNADVDNIPDPKWKEKIDAFIDKCNELKITPILCTIPTIPTKNHDAKNSYIRNCGLRYIDFDRAVRGTNANWYNGMLSDDGIHPTPKGAKALYKRSQIECPEIMDVRTVRENISALIVDKAIDDGKVGDYQLLSCGMPYFFDTLEVNIEATEGQIGNESTYGTVYIGNNPYNFFAKGNEKNIIIKVTKHSNGVYEIICNSYSNSYSANNVTTTGILKVGAGDRITRIDMRDIVAPIGASLKIYASK